MSKIKDYLENLGYSVLSDNYDSAVEKWLSWYSGKVDSFHSYTQYNGKTTVRRSRASLGMAKKVCEDWANLLLNESVDISVNHKKSNNFVAEVLRNNHFRVRANRLIELAFALGSGAFVEYTDEGIVKIDYIRGDMIYPLSWVGGEVKECAFAGEKIIGGKTYVYLNMHVIDGGRYKIINRMFEQNGDELVETSLPPNVASEVETNSAEPLFQIIMPNIVNSLDLGNPLGMSIFADAIDILCGIDLVYDSYQNEFRLGKKRILVPAGMAQIQSGATGFTPIFDDNDTEFYAMADRTLSDIREINMTLRAEPHELALQRNIDLLCMKCGLGTNRYKYNYRNSVLKTATEVMSERSDLYMNVRKNCILLEDALVSLVRGVLRLGGFKTDHEISVHFGDSIIEDTGTVAARTMDELEKGIITKEQYLEKIYGSAKSADSGEVDLNENFG